VTQEVGYGREAGAAAVPGAAAAGAAGKGARAVLQPAGAAAGAAGAVGEEEGRAGAGGEDDAPPGQNFLSLFSYVGLCFGHIDFRSNVFKGAQVTSVRIFFYFYTIKPTTSQNVYFRKYIFSIYMIFSKKK
jgi:hypothetical protein